MRSFSSRFLLNASWLLKLRWVAVFGQLLTVAAAILVFNFEIEMFWAIAVVISLTAVSNSMLTFWFARWQRPELQTELPWELILGLVLVMDMLSLTTLLFATGGPNNPFSLFFFVNLCLCAIMLNRNWAWAINGLTILCFSILLYVHHPMEPLDFGLQSIRDRGDLSLQHLGMLVAFATCASVIVYFMTRLTGELREQQLQVRKAQAHQARSEKLEALGTLAAGAAHELATPLSTIAIVAKDVEQAFEEHPPSFPGADDVVEDVHLIRNQLDRCRRILDRMSSHAGQAIGEPIKKILVSGLTDVILESLNEGERVQLDMSPEAAKRHVSVPVDGLGQAIRGLVQNAIDAEDSTSVLVEVFEEVSVSEDKGTDQAAWCWRITDDGRGMSETELNRVSEPFFTTKEPGKGMGLGVFLAKNVLRRLSGTVEFESEVGVGTRAIVRLPSDKNA